MSKDDMPEYLTEIERLKKKYSDRLEIYVGLESILRRELQRVHPLLPQSAARLPYRSIHFLPIAQPLAEENMVCIDGPFREYQKSVDAYYDGDIRKLVAHYFSSTRRMIEAGGIDIVGHMDKIYMNGHKCEGFDQQADWYQKPFNDCLHLIAEKGLMVEVNTKNLVKKQEVYPHTDYLHRLRELDIPVMVNSDCHYPDLVNDGRAEAFELLKRPGSNPPAN